MAEITSSIVEINLSPFSVSNRFSIHPVLVVPIIFGWFFVILLLLLVSVPLAFALGVVTLAAIFINFIITARRRLTVSTTGRKTDFILAEQLDQRPPAFDRSFGEIIQTVDTFRSGVEADAAPQRAAAMSRRTHAAIYIVFGIVIVVIGLPLIFALRLGGALLGPAVMLVVAAMYAMFTRARRVLQPSADVAQQDDPRPPVLFLRSFQDDRYKLMERVRVAGVPINQPLRMEEALAVRFHDFGPFLAVGEPGEGLPQLGAARAYLSDDQWQAAVVNWIRGSRLIAMLCGPTHWIHWEMQNIIRFKRLDRVLLLLPPGRKPGSASARQRQERWDNIVRSLEQTPYVSALRHLQIDYILLVQFRPDGRVRVFRSASDLVQDYELALTLAIYTALTEPGATETPPVGEPVAPLILPRDDFGGATTAVAPPRDNWLAAKVALSGLIGGVVASGVAATPGNPSLADNADPERAFCRRGHGGRCDLLQQGRTVSRMAVRLHRSGAFRGLDRRILHFRIASARRGVQWLCLSRLRNHLAAHSDLRIWRPGAALQEFPPRQRVVCGDHSGTSDRRAGAAWILAPRWPVGRRAAILGGAVDVACRLHRIRLVAAR